MLELVGWKCSLHTCSFSINRKTTGGRRMILSLVAIATSSVIADSIVTGCGLGVGIYCASRTTKNTYMPKKCK